jgi:hypothetical protein
MKGTYNLLPAVYEAALDFKVIQQDNRAAKSVTVATIDEALAATEYQDSDIKTMQWTGPLSPE